MSLFPPRNVGHRHASAKPSVFPKPTFRSLPASIFQQVSWLGVHFPTSQTIGISSLKRTFWQPENGWLEDYNTVSFRGGYMPIFSGFRTVSSFRKGNLQQIPTEFRSSNTCPLPEAFGKMMFLCLCARVNSTHKAYKVT